MEALIIGGGIAGLAAALSLEQWGIMPRVYERSTSIREIGAGIGIAPNGMAVLERLGLADEILQAGVYIGMSGLANLTSKKSPMIDSVELESRYGYGTVMLHRGRLQRILADEVERRGIEIVTGAEVTRCETVREPANRARVEFADGRRAEGDILIGADGIRSAVRDNLFPNVELRYAGQTSWRLVTRLPEAATHDITGFEVWGNTPGLRVGLFPINEHETYAYFTQKTDEGGKDSPEHLHDELSGLFGEYPTIVEQVIRSVPAEEIHRFDLYDLPSLPSWSRGNICLIGDAAHATTPNLGQGACQGLESALVLGETLGTLVLQRRRSIEEAFRLFEKKRRSKTSRVRKTSRRLGMISNSASPVRRTFLTMMGAMPQSLMFRQLDPIFRLK